MNIKWLYENKSATLIPKSYITITKLYGYKEAMYKLKSYINIKTTRT